MRPHRQVFRGAHREGETPPATWIKRSNSGPDLWINEHLHLGPPDAVSRYVGEVTRREGSKGVGIATDPNELGAKKELFLSGPLPAHRGPRTPQP